MRFILRGRRSIWWCCSVILRRRRSIWWCCSVIFRSRGSIWWCCSVTFRGRRNICWCCSVTFRGRRSIWWNLGRLPEHLNVVIFDTKCISKVRKVTSANRWVIMVESAAHWKWHFNRFRQVSLRFRSAIVGQAQYLVRLNGDACCSAYCKWRFICEHDPSWQSFCVAGAVFDEVGGCLLLLRLL